ncbi:basic proline-rich protein-like [Cydia pomonella]|uniref:basic proline-rich protein-like n=1 Tax=Cydia pomonella TaxID=82600 RepID=UPI002ADD4E15|nr:basic proline-rich protein-like [Cydia pomonella]
MPPPPRPTATCEYTRHKHRPGAAPAGRAPAAAPLPAPRRPARAARAAHAAAAEAHRHVASRPRACCSTPSCAAPARPRCSCRSCRRRRGPPPRVSIHDTSIDPAQRQPAARLLQHPFLRRAGPPALLVPLMPPPPRPTATCEYTRHKHRPGAAPAGRAPAAAPLPAPRRPARAARAAHAAAAEAHRHVASRPRACCSTPSCAAPARPRCSCRSCRRRRGPPPRVSIHDTSIDPAQRQPAARLLQHPFLRRAGPPALLVPLMPPPPRPTATCEYTRHKHRPGAAPAGRAPAAAPLPAPRRPARAARAAHAAAAEAHRHVASRPRACCSTPSCAAPARPRCSCRSCRRRRGPPPRVSIHDTSIDPAQRQPAARLLQHPFLRRAGPPALLVPLMPPPPRPTATCEYTRHKHRPGAAPAGRAPAAAPLPAPRRPARAARAAHAAAAEAHRHVASRPRACCSTPSCAAPARPRCSCRSCRRRRGPPPRVSIHDTSIDPAQRQPAARLLQHPFLRRAGPPALLVPLMPPPPRPTATASRPRACCSTPSCAAPARPRCSCRSCRRRRGPPPRVSIHDTSIDPAQRQPAARLLQHPFLRRAGPPALLVPLMPPPPRPTATCN